MGPGRRISRFVAITSNSDPAFVAAKGTAVVAGESSVELVAGITVDTAITDLLASATNKPTITNAACQLITGHGPVINALAAATAVAIAAIAKLDYCLLHPF